MAGVAVHHHGKIHAGGNPASNLDAFGQADRSDIGHAGNATDDATGADETDFAAVRLHHAGQRRGRRMQHRQDLALAMDHLLQLRGLRAHATAFAALRCATAASAASRPAIRPNTAPAIKPVLPG